MNKFYLNVYALRQNIKNIRTGLKKQTLFCAMVKANAYGHGIKNVCKNIHDLVDYFGVACVREALQIRSANLAKPILVVGAYDKQTARLAIINYITLTVCSAADILHLQSLCEKLGLVCDVHIKINTGMNRLGVSDKDEFDKMLKLLLNNDYIKLKGIFSHFNCSDSDESYTKKQNTIFKAFIKKCRKFTNLIYHISSSFCAVAKKKYHYDMVRVGLSLYGYSYVENITLVPAIEIKGEIKALNWVKAGDCVGYGRTFKAVTRRMIATVPLGYADGINLKLSNSLTVKIREQKAAVVGRICMDMFMCDVTNIKDVKVGDEVTIFDKTNNATVLAKLCGNHEYEILTSFKTNRMKIIIKKQ